ncbi:MAG: zinc-binding dehydrogenase, partial [Pyrinomonadaceae bacterium]|nr:zinc-binding dehydrogenase [Pyrinomonadaceae bacterium]
GPGPVGLAAAAAAFLLGAGVVIVTGHNAARLAHARSFGCETIDLTRDGSINEQIEQILGVPEVDCAIDCVGFEAKGHGGVGEPAIVLNQLMEATRAAGAIGIPGLYVTEDPGAKDESARHGYLSLRLGLGWAKSISFATGQTPVMKYNRELMMAILHDRIQIAKAVNVEVIPLEKAPEAYQAFDAGVPKKFVIDPNHSVLH